jgi:serine protease AprX
MAAPMVSGAAALLAEKFGPSITPDAIKAKLMKSAAKSFPASSTVETQVIQSDMFTIGAGYLDVMAALNNTDTVPAGKIALSPSAGYTCGAAGGKNCVQVRHAANSVPTTTSRPALWGNRNGWGGSVLSGDGGGLFPLSILGQGDR